MKRIARAVCACAAVFLLASGIPRASDTGASAPIQRVPFDRQAYLMGTSVNLTVWAADRADGQTRLDLALQALEQTDADLSTWRDDSPISVLNATPVNAAWPIPENLCPLFGALEDWQRETGGTFDPAIGSLIGAWDLHGSGRIPSAAELARARAQSGWSHMRLARDRCAMTREGAATIDAGAFGKGEALDRAADVLGDAAWMIDFGGQISIGVPPPGEPGWRLSVAHPLDRTKPVMDVTVHSGSLATSAGSERDVMVGRQRVGHILDPRSGKPAAFTGSATVWHRSGLVADILSTALFVMGPQEGLRWAEAHDIAACYLEIDGSGRVRPLMTPSFPAACAPNVATCRSASAEFSG